MVDEDINEIKSELNFLEIINISWRYKWAIIASVAVFVIIAVGLFYRQNPMFRVEGVSRALIEGDSHYITQMNEHELLPFNENQSFAKYVRELRDIELFQIGLQEFGLVDRGQMTDVEYKEVLRKKAIKLLEGIDYLSSGEITEESGAASRDVVLITIDGPDGKAYSDFVAWLLSRSESNLIDSMISASRNNLGDMKNKNQLEISKTEQEIQLSRVEHLQVVEDKITALILEKRILVEEHFAALNEDIYVLEQEIDLLRKEGEVELEDEIQDITYRIEALKNKYESEKRDLIEYLSEQASLAEVVGIESSNVWNGTQLPTDSGFIVTNIQQEEQPYYYRGKIAIEQEITEIQQRTSDDSFVGGLRDSEYKLAVLQNKRHKDGYIVGLRDKESRLRLYKDKIGRNEYITGLTELEYRIEELNSQKSDEFVIGLRLLQTKLLELNDNVELDRKTQLISSYQENPESISLVQIDTKNVSSKSLNRPLLFFLAAGVLFGLVFSVLFIIVKINYPNNRLVGKSSV